MTPRRLRSWASGRSSRARSWPTQPRRGGLPRLPSRRGAGFGGGGRNRGGRGVFGRALGQRMQALGIEVLIGSRDPERARELALVYGVSGGANEEVARVADLVILSVPGRAAVDTARGLADAIGSTPVVSVASGLRFTEAGILPGRLGRSLAEEVADVLGAPLAAGFQTLAAAHLAAAEPPDEDVLVCGDENPAKTIALEL